MGEEYYSEKPNTLPWIRNQIDFSGGQVDFKSSYPGGQVSIIWIAELYAIAGIVEFPFGKFILN